MTIRRATVGDADAIRRIAGDSWEADYPSILSRESVESGVEEWYDPARVRGAVEADDELLYVAERGEDTTADAADAEEIVGFAHGVVDGNAGAGHVLRLYVHPDARGEGRGRRLLERVRDDLFDRGVDRIHATVLRENEPGNEFYRSFGFERTGEAETTIGGEAYPETNYTLRRTR
ncbi:GNAT family N-acetyltransferase [Halobaculum magnesiiphilum]|uniref:GNAT family N-acetyltransferase n=1 Tax=Halobaculum magnesiiphilum TaxID=1017351 RepID=A0A8T8WDI2_9EURY|nr:GNAT family N-acetyltransferase [Halobaculum magnesiiphilum]QZP37794.1 GNAT family N-acetyltransferase [Halobaculum magnesiiphilum]